MSTLVDGDAKKAAIGAVAAGGALAAAKLGWDRLSSGEDRRRFRLAEGEPVTEGIVRIADGQLELAIERLEGNTDEDLGTAVHEARKSFKRLRTTVRLARDELGDEVYRRENAGFRDAGRRLAGARDSQVLLEALAAISERYPEEAEVRRVLIERADRVVGLASRPKLGTVAPFGIAPASALTHIATERDVPDELLAPFVELGIHVVR